MVFWITVRIQEFLKDFYHCTQNVGDYVNISYILGVCYHFDIIKCQKKFIRLTTHWLGYQLYVETLLCDM